MEPWKVEDAQNRGVEAQNGALESLSNCGRRFASI
jgi:hypothetical protein